MLNKLTKRHIPLVLEQSSRVLGLDVEYFGKNLAWVSLPQLVSAGLSFLLAIAFAAYLPKTIFGHFNYVGSLFNILGFLGLSGMGVAVARGVAKGRIKIFPRAMGVSFLASLLGSLILLVLALVFSDPALVAPIIVAAIILPFYQAGRFYGSFLQGLKNFKLLASFSLIVVVASPILMIAALALGVRSLPVLLLLALGSTASLQMLFSAIILRKRRIVFEFSRLMSKDVVYGLQLSITDVMPTIALHIDKVLIGILLPSTELAIYSFAVAIPEFIKGYMKNISFLSLPKLSQMKFSEYKKSIWRYFWIVMIASLLVIGSYVLLAPYLFSWFFPAYIESVELSQWFAASLITVPSFLFISAFQAYKKTVAIAKLNLLFSILQLVLLVILIQTAGIKGAIIARVLARLVTATYAGLLFFNS